MQITNEKNQVITIYDRRFFS